MSARDEQARKRVKRTSVTGAKRERLPGNVRRKLILERSREVFARHTYAEASTALLAEASGVSEPMLYKHFGSKKGLFLAVLNTFLDAALDDWQTRLEEKARVDPLAALREAVYHYFLATSDPQISALILQAMAASADDPEMGDVVRNYQSRLVDVIHRLLERLQRAGIVAESVPLYSAAWGLVSSVIAIQFNRMVLPHPEDLPSEWQEFGRQMMAGALDLWLFAVQHYPG